MPIPVATERYLFAGTCTSHETPRAVTGAIIPGTGVPNVLINGLPVATITSQVLASCGHTGIITTGSTKCYAGGKGVALVTSLVGPLSGNVTGAITGPPGGTPTVFSEF